MLHHFALLTSLPSFTPNVRWPWNRDLMTARPRLLPPDFFDFCGIGAINETAKKIGKLYAKSAQLNRIY